MELKEGRVKTTMCVKAWFCFVLFSYPIFTGLIFGVYSLRDLLQSDL